MNDEVIEMSTGNVYVDLDFVDAGSMLLKAQLAARISHILTEKGWSQTQSAQVLGIPQSKLSMMLRGQFRGISEAKMLECLARLGRDIRIAIGPEHAGVGQVQVI